MAGSSATSSAVLTLAAQYSSGSFQVPSQSVVSMSSSSASSAGVLTVTAPTTSWQVRSQECGIICPECGPSQWCRKHESHVDACVWPQGIDHFPQRAVSGRLLSSPRDPGLEVSNWSDWTNPRQPKRVNSDEVLQANMSWWSCGFEAGVADQRYKWVRTQDRTV